jgi:hypothetical protein
MTPKQFRKLLSAARNDAAFERYIQRKRRTVQRNLNTKTKQVNK